MMDVAMQLASQVKLLVLDVDGVLTDGRIIYSSTGEELKQFHIQDGLGIKLLMDNGIDVAIITGRVSEMVVRRASELGISHVIQGREDKLRALDQLLESLPYGRDAVAYMGDDLPDLACLGNCRIGLTVVDAHPELVSRAHWISQRGGGQGAVREACDFLLRAQGKYLQVTRAFGGEETQ